MGNYRILIPINRFPPPPSPHPYGVLKKGLAQWVSRESVQMYSVPKGELCIRSCD